MQFKYVRQSSLVAASALCILSAPAFAASPCPAINLSSQCSVVITESAGGTFSLASTGVGPYDGSDDTLIGVINNSATALTSLSLSGGNIFGFESDGPSSFTGVSYGPTGYEGPNTSFTVTDANDGVVNFLNGGVAPNGGTAWFALEENLSGAVGTPPPITVGGGVPEPTTWAMMLVGLGAVGYAMRKRNVVRAAVAYG